MNALLGGVGINQEIESASPTTECYIHGLLKIGDERTSSPSQLRVVAEAAASRERSTWIRAPTIRMTSSAIARESGNVVDGRVVRDEICCWGTLTTGIVPSPARAGAAIGSSDFMTSATWRTVIQRSEFFELHRLVADVLERNLSTLDNVPPGPCECGYPRRF